MDTVRKLIADSEDNLPSARLLYLHSESTATTAMLSELRQHGFSVTDTQDPASAIAAAFNGTYDLVLVTHDQTCLSGADAVRALRRHSNLPVILLTQHSDELERILCLELGADDILEQPSSRELIARIRAILRRIAYCHQSTGFDEWLQSGPLQLWPRKRAAHWHHVDPGLTSTEFSLLELLVRQQGRPVSKRMLSSAALGRPYQRADRTVDVHISNIRRKLGSKPDGGDWIQTIRGVGYLWATA